MSDWEGIAVLMISLGVVFAAGFLCGQAVAARRARVDRIRTHPMTSLLLEQRGRQQPPGAEASGAIQPSRASGAARVNLPSVWKPLPPKEGS